MTRSITLSVALAATFLFAAGHTTLEAGTNVSFPSAKLGLPGDSVTVSAQLAKPDGAGPFPAVVLLHTCGGVLPHLSQHWPDYLTRQGYVALTVDTFGSHGVIECAPGIKPVDWVRDAYGALKYLASQSYVDGNRVGVIGFSMGARAINSIIMRRKFQKRARSLGLNFGAGISLYGPCDALLKTKRTPFPLIQIIGDKDDFAEDCAKIAQGPVKVHMLAGIYHNFDSEENTGKADKAGNMRWYDRKATKKAMEITKNFLARQFGGAPGGASAGGFLSGDAIRAALAGKTIKYSPARGGTVSIFFKGDGSLLGKSSRNPGRTFRKKWWVKGPIVCRTIGRDNREHCNKVAVSGNTAKFFKPSGQLRYEAKLLKGKRLAQ